MANGVGVAACPAVAAGSKSKSDKATRLSFRSKLTDATSAPDAEEAPRIAAAATIDEAGLESPDRPFPVAEDACVSVDALPTGKHEDATAARAMTPTSRATRQPVMRFVLGA
ncbi:MAG: hypothetical protein F4X68_12940 [Acidimicrobiia bacterium]|nr:hypothetical protein [Acidimicrobiia bacterium]